MRKGGRTIQHSIRKGNHVVRNKEKCKHNPKDIMESEKIRYNWINKLVIKLHQNQPLKRVIKSQNKSNTKIRIAGRKDPATIAI